MRASSTRLTAIGLALIAAALGLLTLLNSSRDNPQTSTRGLSSGEQVKTNSNSFDTLASPKLQPQQNKPHTSPAQAADLSSIFPPQEMPAVATAHGATISLGYLAKNGADLSKPMPSRHHLFAANQQIAAQLSDWGKANGFQIRGPVMFPDHVGTPRYQLDLVRTEVPDPARIEAEGRMILATVQKTPGSYYQTWSGEIVR